MIGLGDLAVLRRPGRRDVELDEERESRRAARSSGFTRVDAGEAV